MLNKFVAWFETDCPNFVNRYGELMKFYDKESDEFYIEEIQTAYEEFKTGENPDSLYKTW